VTEQNIQLQELLCGLSAGHFSKSYCKKTKNTNGPKFADPRVAAVDGQAPDYLSELCTPVAQVAE